MQVQSTAQPAHEFPAWVGTDDPDPTAAAWFGLPDSPKLHLLEGEVDVYDDTGPVFQAGAGVRFKIGEAEQPFAAANGSLCHTVPIHVLGWTPDVMVLSPEASRCCKTCLRIAASCNLHIIGPDDLELRAESDHP